MSSDEEDFNDIYGDEHQDQQQTVSNESKPVDSTTAPSTESASVPMDPLAALQALSSNLNNSNNTDNNNDKDTSSGSQTTADGNVVSSEQNGSNVSSEPQVSNQTQNSEQGESIEEANRRQVKADLSRENCKMFIGGLNWETTEDGLREYFSKYGNVVELKIMKDPNTGRSRGFGFLSFDAPSSVDEVVKTQHILDGKVIDPKRAIPREEQDKTGKIFVGGLGTDVRPKEFEEYFSQWGTIIDAQLMLDKDTGRSRGFGFVTYDSPDAAEKVCESRYREFKGKQIEIKRAEPRHQQKQAGQQAVSPPVAGMGMNPMSNPMANPMAGMYQNPMMGGFNPMFNPQAMQDYYQKMQEYYQQLQQQTGMDYSQMFQQQMSMMMPGFQMPPMNADGSGSPLNNAGSENTPSGDDHNGSDNSSSSNVQTIGGDSNDSNSASNERNEDGSNRMKKNSLPKNIPRGPRGPSERNDRGSYHRDRSGGSRHGGYHGSSNGSYRRERGGYNGGRRSNGYHPYNRS
ncbi:Eukaryotic RNA Recognition Motif (RRM) profile [Nakaseomyces glabratus]